MQLSVGKKHSTFLKVFSPSSALCWGSEESSRFKVNVKLIWKTYRALQLKGLLLSPLQNRSDGLLLEPWLWAWLTLDPCLLSISGVSCALLWPFMWRTSRYCGYQLCKRIRDTRWMLEKAGILDFPLSHPSHSWCLLCWWGVCECRFLFRYLSF